MRQPSIMRARAKSAARCFGAVLAHSTLAVAVLAQEQGVERIELLDGELSRWTVENTDAGNFNAIGGVLEVREPEGWLKSAERYADFELAAEFRFMTDDADSGIFVRALGEREFARGWPNQSYQVQLRNPLGQSPFPPVGGIFRHGMASGETAYDEDLARATSRPTGEWQTITVRVDGDVLTVALNGVEITRAAAIGNESGFIGIQGETGILEFRSIKIRNLRP
jgi:hypothetical protein